MAPKPLAQISMSVSLLRNDPPVAGSTSYMVNEDNAITISDDANY